MSQGILERILANKRVEVARLTMRSALVELRRLAGLAPPPRDFLAALRQRPGGAVIAEIKRASPSAGKLAPEVNPAGLAAAYESGGAAALSVLTDRVFFGGSLEDLRRARAASSLPVLRKDFIISPAQLYEARAAGADAVLLIAAALEAGLLGELYDLARELGLTPLVEIHRAAELETVLALAPDLVGINNRNLETLEVDLDTCLRLRPLLPAGVTVVAESGIHGPEDLARLRAGGLDAFLVGTSLMRASDPGAALRALTRGKGALP